MIFVALAAFTVWSWIFFVRKTRPRAPLILMSLLLTLFLVGFLVASMVFVVSTFAVDWIGWLLGQRAEWLNPGPK